MKHLFGGLFLSLAARLSLTVSTVKLLTDTLVPYWGTVT